METVLSKDGTPIVYQKVGSGPPVIFVPGALGTGMDPTSIDLAERLSLHFTAVNYGRRGRGGSGDTPPYAVDREIEDIEAVIDAVGGSAFLYGISSGGALVLETTAKIPNKVKKAVLYEAPYIVDNSHAPLPDNYVQHLNELIAQGKRGDAVEYFMTAAVGVPAEYIAPMRADPMWPGLEAVAHTIAYDGQVMGKGMSGKPFPPGKWATATAPILVAIGSAGDAFMQPTADALVAQLPNAEKRVLEGQDHNVSSEALAPVLIDFFTN